MLFLNSTVIVQILKVLSPFAAVMGSFVLGKAMQYGGEIELFVEHDHFEITGRRELIEIHCSNPRGVSASLTNIRIKFKKGRKTIFEKKIITNIDENDDLDISYPEYDYITKVNIPPKQTVTISGYLRFDKDERDLVQNGEIEKILFMGKRPHTWENSFRQRDYRKPIFHL